MSDICYQSKGRGEEGFLDLPNDAFLVQTACWSENTQNLMIVVYRYHVDHLSQLDFHEIKNQLWV